MKRNFAATVVGCVVAAATLTACGSSSGKGPEVVAASYPLFEAAAKIGGEKIHATNLLPVDPKAVLSAKKAKELRDADLAIVLGGGTQPEVDKVIAERTGPTFRVLGDGEIHASENDYNVWLDPLRMTRIAESIRDSLMELSPMSDAIFTKNFKAYQTDIAQVDANYAKTLATCKQSEVLVEQGEFSTLTERFNLRQQVIGPLTMPTINEDARKIIAKTEASTVFAAKLPSLDDAGKLKDTYGVRVAVLDPIQTQTDQARRGGATWKSVMDINLDALRAALDCASKEH